MFQRGPVVLAARGTATDDKPAFTVTDRNIFSFEGQRAGHRPD
jgi:hypothetical protein